MLITYHTKQKISSYYTSLNGSHNIQHQKSYIERRSEQVSIDLERDTEIHIIKYKQNHFKTLQYQAGHFPLNEEVYIFPYTFLKIKYKYGLSTTIELCIYLKKANNKIQICRQQKI